MTLPGLSCYNKKSHINRYAAGVKSIGAMLGNVLRAQKCVGQQSISEVGAGIARRREYI